MFTRRLSPDENLGFALQVSQPLPVKSNPHLPRPLGEIDHLSGPLQRLVSGVVPQDELAPLIESIVSNVKAATIVATLRANDAQAFIEVMDNVWMTHFHLQGIF